MKLIYELGGITRYGTNLTIWDKDKNNCIDLMYSNMINGDDEIYLVIGLGPDLYFDPEQDTPEKMIDEIKEEYMEIPRLMDILKQFLKDHKLSPAIDFVRYSDDYNMEISFDPKNTAKIKDLMDGLVDH